MVPARPLSKPNWPTSGTGGPNRSEVEQARAEARKARAEAEAEKARAEAEAAKARARAERARSNAEADSLHSEPPQSAELDGSPNVAGSSPAESIESSATLRTEEPLEAEPVDGDAGDTVDDGGGVPDIDDEFGSFVAADPVSESDAPDSAIGSDAEDDGIGDLAGTDGNTRARREQSAETREFEF